jgi:methyl halide transferase
MNLSPEYWNKRYSEQDISWDIGYPSTPIKEYFDQLADKDLEILIPGCGNAYEAEYLYEKGFKNISLIDISPVAINNFHKRVPGFPKDQLLCENFFDQTRTYDLIVEQTFFCAIDPALRPAYAKKMHELLKPGGKLIGLLFDCKFESKPPPFGGSKDEYVRYFEPYFLFKTFEKAYNSIPPRAGRELFIDLIKK